jgi:HSP20 family protein
MKQEKEEKKDEKVIYSERSYGMVSRSFSLPSEVDASGAKAEYKDGVLNLVLPKKANAQARRLQVS